MKEEKLRATERQSLKGRVFMLEENCLEGKQKKLRWLRGNLSTSYLASSHEDSFLWRQRYLSTFFKKELPELGFLNLPAEQIHEFCKKLATFHGQIFNASKIGRASNLIDWKVRRYLDVLTKTKKIKKLFPWTEKLPKRQVKSFKIYFPDSGILNALLGIHNEEELDLHLKKVELWQSFALFQTIEQLKLQDKEIYFWKTLAGAELSLFFIKNGKRIGCEFQYTDDPKITPAMRIAVEDLKLDQLCLVFPGHFTFSLSEKILAQGLETVSNISNF